MPPLTCSPAEELDKNTSKLQENFQIVNWHHSSGNYSDSEAAHRKLSAVEEFFRFIDGPAPCFRFYQDKAQRLEGWFHRNDIDPWDEFPSGSRLETLQAELEEYYYKAKEIESWWTRFRTEFNANFLAQLPADKLEEIVDFLRDHNQHRERH